MSARGGQALDRRYWALLLGTALGVRLLFSVLAMAGLPLVSDDSAYSLQAEGFTRDFPGDEPYYWPPGTSYVLALADELLGASSAVARLTMVAVSLLTLVATVLLARQVLDDPRAVRLTGWILALMPSAVFLPSQPFSFDLTMLGITVAVLGTLLAHDRGRLGWLALAGLGLGVAAAARPGSASLLAALVPIGAVVLARRWRAGERALVGRMALGAVLGTLIAVAAVVPTMLHNCDVGAGAVVSTNNEGNLLFGNNPWTPHYKTWHQGQHAFEDLSPPETAYFKRVFSSDGDPEKRELMREEALDYMGDNPGVTLLRTVNRARAFWGFDYTYANNLSESLMWPSRWSRARRSWRSAGGSCSVAWCSPAWCSAAPASAWGDS